MSIEVSNLDHLGLVAGLVDEIGIVALINERLGENVHQKISAGQVVKGMILNGLGLVSSPLYLFSRFWEGKAIEHLLGEGIKAEYLNDDRLGRVLDSLYQTGLNQIFISIVIEVVKKYKIEVEKVHLDSSSFSVQGEYETNYETSEKEPNPCEIKITYGYSRNHRPDLKQFMMNLVSSADGDVPLWMRIGSGNESDQQQFAQIMQDYKSQLKWDSLIVLDSAFFSQENVQSSQGISWLSRVPLRVKTAVKLVQEVSQQELKASELKGYLYKEVTKSYGGIKQRWLVVESEKRREADLKKLEKNIQKEAQEAEKQLRQLNRQTFACIPDAQKMAKKLLKKSRYHHLTNIKIEVVANKNRKSATTEAYRVLGQRQLRQTLQLRNARVPNQLNYPTQSPTLRWIFQCFQSIHVLLVHQTVEISNLSDERLSLLKFFPPACQRYYLL